MARIVLTEIELRNLAAAHGWAVETLNDMLKSMKFTVQCMTKGNVSFDLFDYFFEYAGMERKEKSKRGFYGLSPIFRSTSPIPVNDAEVELVKVEFKMLNDMVRRGELDKSALDSMVKALKEEWIESCRKEQRPMRGSELALFGLDVQPPDLMLFTIGEREDAADKD